MVHTAVVRALVFLAFGLLMAAPSDAQPTGKVPRVGVLHVGSSRETPAIQREPFERGLREAGWIPGSSILLEYRYAEGEPAKLPDLVSELVRTGVDVIVARGPAAVKVAHRATATIPIVMSAGGDDPVAEGLVKNLSRPGGNITGLVSLVFGLDSKRLELLKESFPRISRVAVLANPNIDTGRYEERMSALHASARTLKLQLPGSTRSSSVPIRRSWIITAKKSPLWQPSFPPFIRGAFSQKQAG